MTGPTEPGNGGGFRWTFALPILIGPMLNPINSTMIAVAVPSLSAELHVDAAALVWLLASLYITSAVMQPVLGAVADRIGPRRVFIAGLCVVGVGGLLPLLWPAYPAALAARILLGVGTSAAFPAVLAMIADEERRRHQRAPRWLLTGLSVAALVSAAIGPVLGGVLLLFFDWRSIFAVNVPIAVITAVMAVRWLPRDGSATTKSSAAAMVRALDLIGVLLFAVAVCGVLVFIIDLHLTRWPFLIAGLMAALLFVYWEHRAPAPFIDLQLLLTERRLLRTYIRIALASIASYVFLLGFAPWTQQQYGMNSAESGLLQLPAALSALAAAGSMVWVRRAKVALVAGIGSALLGGVGFVVLTGDSPVLLLIATAVCFGLAQGWGFTANQSVLYLEAAPDRIATAAGLSRTSFYLGAVVASAMVGLSYSAASFDTGLRTLGVCALVASVLGAAMVAFDRRLPKNL